MLTRLHHWFSKAPAARDLRWNADHIADAWFDAHFHFAADVVAEWVGTDRLAAGHTLDFGCGDGITALGLVLRHGALAMSGVDISRTHLGLPKLAQREIALARLPRELQLKRIDPGADFALARPCDTIITWSTFEHIDLRFMDRILKNLHRLLAEDGQFFLQINPLYFSPFGSHLSRFELPAWAHLLWSADQVEDAVMRYQGEIPADELEENFHKRDFSEYKRFVLKEYRELNQLTSDQLKGLLDANGFALVREAYGQVAQEPPAELLQRFTHHDLVTDEVRLLLKKR